jgi:hypothetical protein
MARRVGLGLLLVAGLWAAAGCKDGNGGTGTATSGFRALPEALDFGPTALGQPKTLELKVENRGRSPFTVLEATPSVANVAVEDFQPFELAGGESRALRITFSPSVEGELRGVISLRTDVSDTRGASQLPIAGTGVKAYALLVTDRLDYGNVELNTAQVSEIRLSNPTQVVTSVKVAFAGPDADQFSSSEANQTLTLQPSEVRAVSVAFKPTRLGVAQSFVRVTVCETGCEPAQAELLGSGVASKLDISPLVVNFGRVAMGATSEERVVVRNLGNEPFDLRGASLPSNPGGVYTLTRQPPAGTQLPPGGAVEFAVSFKPNAAGAVRGGLLSLGVVAQGASDPGPKLSLVAEGGSSCVTVLPRALDFGIVPEGFEALREVEIFNRCSDDAVVSSLQVSTTQGGYFTLGQSSSNVEVPAGGSARLAVAFTPRAGVGASAGHLNFKIRYGGSLSAERVTLAGEGRRFAPCSYQLEKPTVSFGSVPVGSEVTLGVPLRNTGSEACYVSTMGLASGSDPQFTSERWQATLVEPGQRAVLPVKFKPTSEGEFHALAEAWVNHPTRGHPTVPLSGRGVLSCLTAQPTTVDFGLVKLGCAPRTRSIAVFNNCSTPVTLNAVGTEPGATSEYTLLNPPGTPFVLGAGQRTTVQVRYQPTDDGQDLVAFLVDPADTTVLGDGVLTVGLVGRGKTRPTQQDRFLQENQSKVDVLFVIDNSGSMAEEQQSMAQNFASFLSWAQRNKVDYHIAVTTTGIDAAPGGWSVCPGGADGGEGGRLFPVSGNSPRIITPRTPSAEAVFANNVRVGICHWDEHGLEAAYKALSPPLVNNADDPRSPVPADGNLGFLRDDAKLAVVFLSDEDDSSPGAVSYYETFFKALKGNNPALLSFSAIVGPEDLRSCPTASGSGSRYIALARATDGVVENICTPDWAASLEKLGQNTFGARRSFELTETPADPAAITVNVNGAPQTTGWSYDAGLNAIVFTADGVPPPGSIIDVTYPLGC